MDNKVLDLLEIRDQIDGIDKEIVELFEKRMQLSAEVAEYKISTGKKILKPTSVVKMMENTWTLTE